MDALTLLTEARAAGLAVSADGDRLVIYGPARAAPLVRALMARKSEVLALLRPPAPSAPPGAPAAAAADSTADQGAACPRCATIDRQAGEVLAQLAASPALPPALRALPPERLAILVKWTLIALTNPRPQWPPPPPPPRGRARPSLAGAIVALGGEPVGGDSDSDSDSDAAPQSEAEEDTDG